MKKTKKASNPFGAAFWPKRCPRPDDEAWDSLPWPNSVPILTPSDVCKSHDIPLGKPPYNIDGWFEVTFEKEGNSAQENWIAHIARSVLLHVIEKRTGKPAAVSAVWEYAWCEGVTKPMLASVWNEAMEMLGYDVSKPEKKKDEFEEFFS